MSTFQYEREAQETVWYLVDVLKIAVEHLEQLRGQDLTDSINNFVFNYAKSALKKAEKFLGERLV